MSTRKERRAARHRAEMARLYARDPEAYAAIVSGVRATVALLWKRRSATVDIWLFALGLSAVLVLAAAVDL